jgi:hypothetical protein
VHLFISGKRSFCLKHGFVTFSTLQFVQVKQKYLSYAEVIRVRFLLKRAGDRSNKDVLEKLTSVLI